MDSPKQSLFDDRGWRVPGSSHRTFSRAPKWFYRTTEAQADPQQVFQRVVRHLPATTPLEHQSFESALSSLTESVRADVLLAPLLRGVSVPFVLPRLEGMTDIGSVLEQHLLPAVSKSFTEIFPGKHFKAVVQDKTSLTNKLSVMPSARYEAFTEAVATGPVCGLYFPQALQEYDVASQAAQMADLPLREGLVLSGPLEVAAALVGFPELLIHEDAYAPVLCLSGVQHTDSRLMCCFKAYGPHLEFWCMSQMLTPGVKQVSEQWSGGLTIFVPMHA